MAQLLITKQSVPLHETDIPIQAWVLLNQENELHHYLKKGPHLNMPHEIAHKHHFSLQAEIDQFFIPQLASYLNKLHDINESDEFWAIIIKPWLAMVVSTTYYYFLILQELIQANKNLTVELLELNTNWEFKDTQDFINNGRQNEAFHTFLISALITHLFDQSINITKTIAFTPPKANFKNGYESVRDYRSRRFIKVPGINGITELLFSAILLFKQAKNLKASSVLLEKKAPFLLNHSFKQAMLLILKQCMPLAFTKNFSNFHSRAQKKHYSKGKIRIVGAITMTFEQMKFYLAHAHKHGEILITSQHGGNYGWHLSHWEPDHIEYRFDGFISWGWQPSQARTTIFPLPSPYLGQFKLKKRKPTESIILIGTELNPFLTTCFPSFHEGKKLLDYRHQKTLFIDTLSEENLKKLHYRAYPHKETRLNDGAFLKEKFPKLQLLEGSVSTFHKALLNTSCCVLDHLGTSLIICLAANIPFICFWNENHCDLNEDGKTDLKLLKQAGLYFNTAEEAAHTINTISCFKTWWKSKQSKLEALQKKHSLSHNWFKAYLNFIKKL